MAKREAVNHSENTASKKAKVQVNETDQTGDPINDVSSFVALNRSTPNESSALNRGENEEASRSSNLPDLKVENVHDGDKGGEGSNSTGSLSKHDSVSAPKKQSKVTIGHSAPNASNAVTVQSIIPNPTKCLVDEKQIVQYPEGLKKRIHQLSEYVNKSANVYSLGNVLSTATWGKYHPLSDRSNQICNPATNEVVVLWITGHIVSTWFHKDGYPEKQASVSIMPLSDALRVQMARLLTGFSLPRENTIDTSTSSIRAIRWQTAKGENNPILFSSVYDAREVLKSKVEMETFSPVDLKKNDLVLLEARITRYRMKDVKTEKWGQRAQLEMIALSLLHSANSNEEESEEERNIENLCI